MLKSWLATNHHTHAWLAEQLSVGAITVYRWLAGKRLPQRKYREKIEALTGGVVRDALWFESAQFGAAEEEPETREARA